MSIRLFLRGAAMVGAVLLAGLLQGCGAPVARTPYDYTAFKASRPRSILVVTPTNLSPDVKASAGLLAQVTRPLAESGYYVMPVTLTQETFRQNGLTSAEEVQAVSIEKLRAIFGADAVLYIDIEKYGAHYNVIDSAAVVAAQARLVDLRDGKLLWSGKATASSAEGRTNNGQGLIGVLLTAVVNQVIGNLSDASFGVAGVASNRLLLAGPPTGMLYGPRSPRYQAD